jgi:chemosensory pili system protein ChpA (sensor histidine kinase/response regulator)
MDDDIDVIDVIDPDLFPIFEEEAAELLPVLGGALRQWAARPDNMGARTEVLRALHTLKGSARLAGAMRLGELSHRLESAIEQLDVESVQAQDIEPLQGSFDGLEASFDALRAISAQAPTEPVAVAPVKPSEAVVAADTAPATVQVPRAAVAKPLGPIELAPVKVTVGHSVRVRAQLLDRLVNQAGEVMITRSRMEARLAQLKGSMSDLTGNLERLRQQLRDIEVQSESQMQSRLALSKDSAAGFDPLEFDRFTRVQELTRMMAESVNDVATIQRNLQRAVEGTEDDLIAQGRQARELQRDLLRTRMVEFEGIAERLYAVVRQSAKEAGKLIKLDITGGSIEMDRGVLDRMTPAFEHLLRNCVAHGIETPEQRLAQGKPAMGTITVDLRHEGNDVSVEFRDDGAGLNLPSIRAKAVSQGLIAPEAELSEAEAANLIFLPGFSTATVVTGLAGRGIGMDVVRVEVNSLGGRIETTTKVGQGSAFRMVLPLTTAVTQVVMLRAGDLAVGVPANIVEIVRRVPTSELEAAYRGGTFEVAGEHLPFFWSGALLQASQRSSEAATGKTQPVVVLRSASQRIAMHVDEVLGNREVVVKNLGPQLSRLPGLAGMSVLASGAVVLIYNPVALATVYGDQVRATGSNLPLDGGVPVHAAPEAVTGAPVPAAPASGQVPLVLVVDDSITVRRVTQRLLQREGYRVVLAADGLQALERLQEERPTVVLSDIEMPRMDGFDLARNIRSDAALRDLPIIMITSRIAQKHREHAMELGVNHYLGKPYSDDELLSLIQHYAKFATGEVLA